MFKKIAMAALGVVTVSAMAQTGTQTTQKTTTTTTTTNPATGASHSTTTTTISTMGPDEGSSWAQRYDTFHIGAVDPNSISLIDAYRIVLRETRDINAVQAFNLRKFLARIEVDQEVAIVRALVANFRTASMVRDEVAMARFGGDTTFTWLTFPPLVWSDTPGQNSWSALNFPATTTTTTTTAVIITQPSEDTITLTEDQSRPMRMLMSRRQDWNNIDYDQAVAILCSGVDGTDGGIIRNTFRPATDYGLNAPLRYDNEQGLDACIAIMRNNAMMVHNLNRFSWYNHFDPNFYTTGRWQWGD